MVRDDLGNEITADSWLISCFGNYATMRFYYIKGFADDGRLMVHEYHNSLAEGQHFGRDEDKRLRKAKKPQTILRPKSCVVYPFDLLANRFADGELDG